MKRYMEDILNMRIKDIIPFMQEGLLSHSDTYHGIWTHKHPIDVWVYNQILYKVKPKIIIEIGVFKGGSALMFKHMLNNLPDPEQKLVIGIDIDLSDIDDRVANDNQIILIEGDATDKEVHDHVSLMIAPEDTVLVIEDSSHTYENTLAILDTYSHFVTPGSYFIVEDTFLNHGLSPFYAIGTDQALWPLYDPQKAVIEFVANNPEFSIDRNMELFVLTGNPKGYLIKK